MKFSHRKMSPAVDAAGSPSAASAASEGNAARKKIRTPLAQTRTACRQDFIESPRVVAGWDLKILRQGLFRRSRPPTQRLTVPAVRAPLPLLRRALSSRPATPVAQRSARQSQQSGVLPAHGGGLLP